MSRALWLAPLIRSVVFYFPIMIGVTLGQPDSPLQWVYSFVMFTILATVINGFEFAVAKILLRSNLPPFAVFLLASTVIAILISVALTALGGFGGHIFLRLSISLIATGLIGGMILFFVWRSEHPRRI